MKVPKHRQPEAVESTHELGDVVLELKTTVRNHTGRKSGRWRCMALCLTRTAQRSGSVQPSSSPRCRRHRSQMNQ